VTAARIRKAEHYLKKTDTTLGGLIDTYGPCTLMSSRKPHFHTLVWAIINQQLSVRAAKSIETRLLQRLNTTNFEAKNFHRIQDKTLRSCGLSGSKVRYIRGLARQVRCGDLLLDELQHLEDEAVSEKLMTLPGIGRWTADMFLMFSLGRLDVLPIGDLALRKSIQQLYGLSGNADYDHYIEIAESWRPYRTVASWYCWAAVD
jgi:DNA-3-methyladenine glycosylase II